MAFLIFVEELRIFSIYAWKPLTNDLSLFVQHCDIFYLSSMYGNYWKVTSGWTDHVQHRKVKRFSEKKNIHHHAFI